MNPKIIFNMSMLPYSIISYKLPSDGLQRLSNLNLESNYLDVKSLKLGVFERIPNLVSMGLSNNLFHICNGYPDKVLSELSQLQSLTINRMDNVSFGGGFESLSSLKSLLTLEAPKLLLQPVLLYSPE
jgi:hypothetical protein